MIMNPCPLLRSYCAAQHEILDQMAHGLVGYSFMGAAACGAVELMSPSSFWPHAGWYARESKAHCM